MFRGLSANLRRDFWDCPARRSVGATVNVLTVCSAAAALRRLSRITALASPFGPLGGLAMCALGIFGCLARGRALTVGRKSYIILSSEFADATLFSRTAVGVLPTRERLLHLLGSH